MIGSRSATWVTATWRLERVVSTLRVGGGEGDAGHGEARRSLEAVADGRHEQRAAADDDVRHGVILASGCWAS